MTDLEKIWRSIGEAIDEDPQVDIDALLENQGLHYKGVPDGVADAAGDVLKSAFDEELPPDLQQSKYVIRERLNTGGQSVIYLADRSDGIYSKTVIIKVMSKRYGHDTFKTHLLREMQLLADHNHPGIVQIIDGGLTKEDQPWLVLEYIEGEHLNEYCRANSLSAGEVAGIFLNLCESLRFIHMRGVVHMDLKAANVLVRNISGVAWPVIIDLGIALEAAARGTEHDHAILGTKGYSAPEQLAGEAVDQRADIYSTGMMLAQVLTRDQVDNVGVLSRKDRESLLRRHNVSQDLIQIIRKCTRNDPDERYSGVDELRNDLNNWLNDYPLIANRTRPLHVAGKTIRRHKLASAAALAVLIGAAAFTYQYTTDIRELQNITQAERNASDALFNYMQTDLFEELTRIGRVDMLRMTAERSLDHLREQDTRTFDGASHLQSAVAYINAGKVFDVLESSTEALAAYAEAEKQLAFIESDPALRREYLRQLATLNMLKSLTSTTDEQDTMTQESLERSVELSALMIAEFPDEEPDVMWEAQLQLGWHHMEYDRPAKAKDHIDAALSLAQQQVTRHQDSGEHFSWLLKHSHSLQALAWYALDYGNPDHSIEAIERAVELARMTLARDEDDIEYLDNYRILLNQKSFFALDAGQVRSAEEVIEEAIRVGQQLKIMAPRSRKYDRELAYSYTTGAELAENRGDLESALAYYRMSLGISRSVARADPDGFSSANDLAIDLTGTANVLDRLGYSDEATSHWREAAEIMMPIHAREPENKYYTFSLVVPLIQLGEYQKARPLIEALRASGMEDEAFQQLLAEHNLD